MLAQRDDRVQVLRKVLVSVASDSLDALLAAKSRRDKPPFGNAAVWNLEMVANLAHLPAKARVGVEILHALVDNGIASRKGVDRHQRRLFDFSMEGMKGAQRNSPQPLLHSLSRVIMPLPLRCVPSWGQCCACPLLVKLVLTATS